MSSTAAPPHPSTPGTGGFDPFQGAPSPSSTTNFANVDLSARGGGRFEAGQSVTSTNSLKSHRTLKFFRNFVYQRKNDYVSDAPQPAPRNVAAARYTSTRSILTSNRTLEGLVLDEEDEDGPRVLRKNWWTKIFCFLCLWPAEDRRTFFAQILRSRFWRWLLILLTFILLFGSQIRNLVIPPSGDTAVDAVFMATFCIFWIDVFMRIDVEPNYFQFNLCGCRLNERRGKNEDGSVSGGSVYGDGFCCNINIGSFLFWCDVISTLTLLHNISFIDRRNFSEKTVTIGLDTFGVPVSGLDSVNTASPIETEVDLLVTIGKTARCARFIRSSTAIKISSKVNWNWFLDRINPLWWWQSCRQSMAARRLRRQSAGTPSEIYFRSSTGSQGPGGETPALLRQNSWGGVGLGALAAVRADRLKEAQMEKGKEGFISRSKNFLRWIGLMSHNDEELSRQVAAIKIQRAWRNAHYGLNREDGHVYDSAEDYSSMDFSWRTRGRGKMRDGAVERALMKRASTKRSLVSSSKSRLSRIPLGSTYNPARRRNESQVGTAMRELTGQRVAIGIIVALALTVLFTYTEDDATRPSTMIVLHNQTANPLFANKSLDAARMSSIPDLFQYTMANGEIQSFSIPETSNPYALRPREIYRVTIKSDVGNSTQGLFAYRNERKDEAYVSLLSTFFILLVWFFGVTAFAGPVMVLVVIPIERMVRLLGMLMVDPLGYENTSRYKRFIAEEDTITKHTRWTKEVLKGMETSFLMSTILRIGSLMKVGFGSAGVEIIRNNLQKGQSKNMLKLGSTKGVSVSCIFLFCDIRQFTDATECLQEEVFVFTNRIAAVVHSICHSYGGSANKNVGDAFLLSWLLDEDTSNDHGEMAFNSASDENFTAKNNQADKALLSVVKISMALHHDDFYIKGMSDMARDALVSKLSRRKGPLVQMGFGLHAGKAVQGAIGSERKIDATYVSEHVERAEFLESSTKKYGVKMLMSDSFHRLLHPSNRRRCRKIDQILIQNEDDAEDDYLAGEKKPIELLTFDMDIDALWQTKMKKATVSDAGHDTDSEVGSEKGTRRDGLRLSGGMLKAARRRSVRMPKDKEGGSDEMGDTFAGGAPTGNAQADLQGEAGGPPELVLPTGPALYNANVWVSEDMRRIRQLYSDGLFFQKFKAGLRSYYTRDWAHAKDCFTTILERFEDGPSRYFLNQIEMHGGVPPRDFKGYGTA